MNKILVAEPIYHAHPHLVYSNRIQFWMEAGRINAIPVENQYRWMVIGPRVSIRTARDKAIRTAIEKRASHLLFLDDDILVPPDIITQLLQVDKPIVGVSLLKDDGTKIVFKDTIDQGEWTETAWQDHPTDGPFECAALGAGVMLIQIGVLTTLIQSYRWLFTYDDSERSMDVLFCRKARAAGFSVWCEPRVPCEQLIHHPSGVVEAYGRSGRLQQQSETTGNRT